MTISVVIATLNRPSDLERALRSVLAQTRPALEVLVIDQSEDDRSLEAVLRLDAGRGLVRHLRQTEKSLVKARNRGLDEARGEAVSFLDDDVELEPDYYEQVERVFAQSPRIGAVGGSVTNTVVPTGWKWNARLMIRQIFLHNQAPGCLTASGFGYPIYERPIRKAVDVQMLHGCNMTFRREAIGSERFDEWFSGYGFREDAEFSYRISKRWVLRMSPEPRLKHFESPANRLDVERLKRMEMRNYLYVARKHRGRGLGARLLFVWSAAGLVALDVLECLSRRDAAKSLKLKASVRALGQAIREPS